MDGEQRIFIWTTCAKTLIWVLGSEWGQHLSFYTHHQKRWRGCIFQTRMFCLPFSSISMFARSLWTPWGLTQPSLAMFPLFLWFICHFHSYKFSNNLVPFYGIHLLLPVLWWHTKYLAPHKYGWLFSDKVYNVLHIYVHCPGPMSSPGRYILDIHFFIESKTKSTIFIRQNIHSI